MAAECIQTPLKKKHSVPNDTRKVRKWRREQLACPLWRR
jgi:hypothetical protein